DTTEIAIFRDILVSRRPSAHRLFLVTGRPNDPVFSARWRVSRVRWSYVTKRRYGVSPSWRTRASTLHGRVPMGSHIALDQRVRQVRQGNGPTANRFIAPGRGAPPRACRDATIPSFVQASLPSCRYKNRTDPRRKDRTSAGGGNARRLGPLPGRRSRSRRFIQGETASRRRHGALRRSVYGTH